MKFPTMELVRRPFGDWGRRRDSSGKMGDGVQRGIPTVFRVAPGTACPHSWRRTPGLSDAAQPLTDGAVVSWFPLGAWLGPAAGPTPHHDARLTTRPPAHPGGDLDSQSAPTAARAPPLERRPHPWTPTDDETVEPPTRLGFVT
jgi:hypothetical protein